MKAKYVHYGFRSKKIVTFWRWPYLRTLSKPIGDKISEFDAMMR